MKRKYQCAYKRERRGREGGREVEEVLSSLIQTSRDRCYVLLVIRCKYQYLEITKFYWYLNLSIHFFLLFLHLIERFYHALQMKPSYGMQVTTILSLVIELSWSCSSSFVLFQRDVLFCIRYLQLQYCIYWHLGCSVFCVYSPFVKDAW